MLRKLCIVWFVCSGAFADTLLLYKTPSENYEVYMGGSGYFEAGSRVQNNTYKVTQNNASSVAFDSAATFHLTIKNYSFKDTTIGLQLGVSVNNISPTQSGSDYWDRTYLWIDNSEHYGYVEYGTNTGAGSTMETNGTNIAVATGGANGSWYKYFNSSTSSGNAVVGDGFLLFPGLVFPDDNFQLLDTNERTRKLTYYTPHYKGIQIGVSYMPDTANYGSQVNMPNFSTANRQPKNGVGAGITWTKTFAPHNELTVALVGEYGIIERSPQDKINNRKFYSDQAYEVGFNYRYNSFVYGASYSQQWRSNLEKISGVDIPNTYFITGGIKYDITSKLRTSISYFYSQQLHNIMNVVGFGGEYNVLPGLLPYFDITYINMNQKYAYNTVAYNASGVATLSRSDAHNDGMAFITGLKVSF